MLDRVSLKEMDCLVAGALGWVLFHAWRVLTPSNLLRQSSNCAEIRGKGEWVARVPQAIKIWLEREPLG